MIGRQCVALTSWVLHADDVGDDRPGVKPDAKLDTAALRVLHVNKRCLGRLDRVQGKAAHTRRVILLRLVQVGDGHVRVAWQAQHTIAR